MSSKKKIPVALPADRSWREPAVSPDGQYLALVSSCIQDCVEGDEGSQIALVNLSQDEANYVLLTSGPGYKRSPVFTNDGAHIVYAFGPDNGRSSDGLARVSLGRKVEVLRTFDDWGIVRAVRHSFFDGDGNYYASIYSADNSIRKPLLKYKSDYSFSVLYKFEKDSYKTVDVVEFAKKNFVSSPSITDEGEIVFSGVSSGDYDVSGTEIFSAKNDVIRNIFSSEMNGSLVKSSRKGGILAIQASDDIYNQKDIYIYNSSLELEKTGISDEIIADLQP
ncbi:MAG: hypothetical protein RJQ14_00155 [Marinoscillum sp.]